MPDPQTLPRAVPEDYRKNLLGEVLGIIKVNLRSGKMKASRAREIAQFTLNKLKPGIDFAEIYRVVPSFGQSFGELNSLSASVGNEYDELVKQTVVPKAQRLISEGKTEEARVLLDQALRKESASTDG